MDKQANTEKPKEALVTQIEPNPLEIIQRDLEVMVMSDEAGELAITTCLTNIIALQSQAQAKNEKNNTVMVPEKSLAYYMALATDFTKLIKFIFQKMNGQPNAIETIRECFAAIDVSGEKSLANVSIDLFTHFIANDSGNAKRQMLIFFKDVLLKQLLTPEEKSLVFKVIMDKFLAAPNELISQKSVIESLLFIEVPSNDLVLYLARGLGLLGDN